MGNSDGAPDDEVRMLPPWCSTFGYFLRWYEKDPGEAFIGDCPIEGIGQQALKQLFGITSNAEMDCLAHAVTAAHVPILRQHVSCAIDLDAFDYFVEGLALP